MSAQWQNLLLFGLSFATRKGIHTAAWLSNLAANLGFKIVSIRASSRDSKSLCAFGAVWLAAFSLLPAPKGLAQTVEIAPTIVAQPSAQTADYGANVAFTVVANGTPLNYQWRKSGVDLADYDNVAGSQTAELKLVGVAQRDVADYAVVVFNSAGAVTSAVARLQVNFTTVFSDDFESGTLSNWTAFSELPGVGNAVRQREAMRQADAIRPYSYRRTLASLNVDGLFPNGTRLSNSPAQNISAGGARSAQMTQTRNKMYHNLGTKLVGRVKATFWIYDDGSPAASCYGEVRGYTGWGMGCILNRRDCASWWRLGASTLDRMTRWWAAWGASA